MPAKKNQAAIPWTRVVLLGLTLGGATMMWAALRALYQGEATGLVLSGLVVGLTMLVVCLGLFAFFTQKRWHYVAIGALAAVSFLTAFGPPEGTVPLAVMAAGCLLFVLGILVAHRTIQDEVQTRLTPRLRRTLGMSMAKIVLPIMVIWAALFYAYPPPSVSGIFYQFSLPRPVFDTLIVPVTNILSSKSQADASGELAKLIKGLGFNLDATLVGSLLNQTTPPTVESAINDRLYQSFNQNLRHFLMPYQEEALTVLAFGFLAALHAAALPYRYFAVWLTILIFGLLEQLGIIRKRTVPADQVRYELKSDHESA